MKKAIYILAIILTSAGSHAQEVFKLYDGKAPGSENWTDPEMTVPAPWNGSPLIFNVTEPTITVYRPDKANDTGAAMIIAPGGANIFLTWKEEGTNVAEWFQRHGVTGILLKYRNVQSGSLEKIEETLKAIMQPAPRPANNSAQGTDTAPRSAAGVPVGLQFIYDARHGDGLSDNGKEWNEWIDNLYNFMKAIKFLDK